MLPADLVVAVLELMDFDVFFDLSFLSDFDRGSAATSSQDVSSPRSMAEPGPCTAVEFLQRRTTTSMDPRFLSKSGLASDVAWDGTVGREKVKVWRA